MSDHMADHIDCGDIDDNTHEVIVQITFSPSAADGVAGDDPHGVEISFHNHNVSPSSAATVLLLIAQKVVADELAHSVFGACPSPELAHSLAEGAARAYLAATVENLANVGVIGESVEIPDDVSSLIEGES